MLERRSNRNKRATVGADKGYDSKAFIKGCRKLKVTPHVAAKDKHSAVDGRIQRHDGYKASQKVRKRIEEAFGWAKTVGGLAKTKLIGQAKLTGQALLCFATYNLVRIGSLGGWWDAHHAWVFRGNVTGHSGASLPTIPAERDRGFRSERYRFWWSPE